MSNTELSDEVREALKGFASLGGKAVKKKYGKAYLSALGKKGMAKRWGKKTKAKKSSQKS